MEEKTTQKQRTREEILAWLQRARERKQAWEEQTQLELKVMAYSYPDKIEWTLIFTTEFGRRFGLTLKQAFNYLSRFGAIKFVDEHYDYCHTQSFQSMVSDMAEYCHRKGGALV